MGPKRFLEEAEWVEILKAAPDGAFYGTLQEILASARLPPGTPARLDATCLAPTRSLGWATAEQCAIAWYNIGIAAVSLQDATPETALFAAECSRLVTDLAPSSADLSLRNHFIKLQALLILASSEETTSPEVCRRLLTETTRYLGATRENLGRIERPSWNLHLAPALSISVRILNHLVEKRRALGTLDAAISQAVELALDLVARVEPGPLRHLSSQVMTGLDPVIYLRRLGAWAELNLALESVGDQQTHAQRALAHMDAIRESRLELPEPLRWPVDLARTLALCHLGRFKEALAQLPDLPESAPVEFKRLRLEREGLCRLALGELDRARDALLQATYSEEEALHFWKARWFNTTPDEQPAIDLRGEDPLIMSQTQWRQLAAIGSETGDSVEVLRWATRASGFLVDSFLRERAAWVEAARRRLRGPLVIERGWETHGDWSSEIARDLEADSGLAPDVPFPEHPITVETRTDRDPLAQIGELLGSSGSSSALILVLVMEEKVLTLVARHHRDRVALSVALPLPDFGELFSRLEQWDHFYFKRLRHGLGSPAEQEEGMRRFDGVLRVAEGLWGPLLAELVEEGYNDLVFIADDLVADVPFHALRLPSSGLRLIDRARIVYAPSLFAAWRCSRRIPKPPDQRAGVALRSLVDPDLPSARKEPAELADLLAVQRYEVDPRAPDFWLTLREAELLHVVAHGRHNVLLPLNSLWMAGWIDLGITKLLAGLDLPRCEVVSNLVCEAAFPAIRRAPGMDLSSVFLIAGARSVLASTWVVNDDLASEFCLKFFQAWKAGRTASRAFQTALTDLRYEQPTLPDFHWAGFRLVGGA